MLQLTTHTNRNILKLDTPDGPILIRLKGAPGPHKAVMLITAPRAVSISRLSLEDYEQIRKDTCATS